MKALSILLFVLGIITGLLGVRSYWRDSTFKKASIAVKASVKSVEIRPFSGKAVAGIYYTLNYMRDGIIDSIKHNTSEEYSLKKPLPTKEKLQAATFYVHYVPKNKRTETSFPDRVTISDNGKYPGFYKGSLFGQMSVLILLGFMVRMFGQKN
ncbi:MAG TPA: hypothetical protein PKX92_03480 [Edaphocola sp.]|nr:hypothetical protein [Edaphocola sp.]